MHSTTIASRLLRLAPLRARHFAEIAAHLAARRADPLALALAALGDLPEPLQLRLLELAYAEARRGPQISVDEVDAWLATPEGTAYAVWLASRESGEAWTHAECRAWIDELPLADWRSLGQLLARACTPGAAL